MFILNTSPLCLYLSIPYIFLVPRSLFTGALVIYVLYTYTSWRTCFLLSGVIPSISLCVIGLLPESPVYLVSKNRPDEARKSLRWLRGWIGQGDAQLGEDFYYFH